MESITDLQFTDTVSSARVQLFANEADEFRSQGLAAVYNGNEVYYARLSRFSFDTIRDAR